MKKIIAEIGKGLLLLALVVYSVIGVALVKKAYDTSKYLNSIPCDHGDQCELKDMSTSFYKAQHSPESYCPLHKMYHHSNRMCINKPGTADLEKDLIRKREVELGYKKPPTAFFAKPEASPIRK